MIALRAAQIALAAIRGDNSFQSRNLFRAKLSVKRAITYQMYHLFFRNNLADKIFKSETYPIINKKLADRKTFMHFHFSRFTFSRQLVSFV